MWRRERRLEVSEEALAVHRAGPVIDLHADTVTLHARLLRRDLGVARRARWYYNPCQQHVDLPRLRAGGITGLGCGSVSFPFRRDPLRPHLETMATARRLVARHPGAVGIALDPEEMLRLNGAGKVALFFGVEGGHALGGRLANVARLHGAGFRYVTLTHFSGNAIAPAATSLGARGGLTPFGRDVLAELERLGIMVDCAHLHPRAIDDVLTRARRPLLVSHAGLRGVYDIWRNLHDEHVRGIAATGGCIGVIYHPAYLGRSLTCSAERIVDHLEHILSLVGDEHAALGSDWDGCIATPWDMPDAAALPRLTHLMLARGWSAASVRRILGGNVLRVWRACVAG